MTIIIYNPPLKRKLVYDKNNKLIGTKSYKIDNSKEITPLFISNSKNIKFSSYSIKNI